jgi:Protein of unknown function (DUF1019).
MKIIPTIEDVANEIEAWAIVDSWKVVGIKISEKYHELLTGDLLPSPDDEIGIRNASQRIRRIFRGRGQQYKKMAQQLIPVVLAAMPKMRSLKLTEPDSLNLLTAKAIDDISSALSALMIRCPGVTEKMNRAMHSLQTLIPIAEMISQ